MQPPLEPLKQLLRHLPDRLHAEVIGRAFNHLLRGQWITEQFDELEGKRVCLKVRPR